MSVAIVGRVGDRESCLHKQHLASVRSEREREREETPGETICHPSLTHAKTTPEEEYEKKKKSLIRGLLALLALLPLSPLSVTLAERWRRLRLPSLHLLPTCSPLSGENTHAHQKKNSPSCLSFPASFPSLLLPSFLFLSSAFSHKYKVAGGRGEPVRALSRA